ncbi:MULTISPECIES: GNAT family N-acetyltransferase [unclassified Burkholderia]|uniref:GNAT family N-acetyltransferase n=1 Tax=unclassified Burkholderia TaxID=2613784 RepID=UPI000F585019|nr:GNAT family N-acetyltransferase [Burkholderia sp. Bp9012]RQR73306.1 GNAT family N-acetyltransferase [Burkholderia sp. Bp9011]RQR85165.1 GNAT family N-acetyltransferase [Burkholderia sp. Bp9010]RQZ40289.1 GNAT family N-acetyltransferase [Burkholderia sp. Bp9099]
MDSVIVRAAVRSDFEQWLPLWNSYLRFYQADIPMRVTEATWARITTLGGDHLCAISEDRAGRMTGFVIYLFHRSSWAETWNCLVEDLFVSEENRGHGIARLLLDMVFQEAELRNCYRTYWQTDETNERAQNLYNTLATRASVVQYRR